MIKRTDHAAIGRRSMNKGKSFERWIARRLNAAIGTRYRRNRLGRTQPLGDLVPDEDRPAPAPGSVAYHFETTFHLECKANLVFSWDSVLAGKSTVLEIAWRSAELKAAVYETRLLRPVLFCRHKGTTYVMIEARELKRFRATTVTAPELRTGERVVLTLDAFLDGLTGITNTGRDH